MRWMDEMLSSLHHVRVDDYEGMLTNHSQLVLVYAQHITISESMLLIFVLWNLDDICQLVLCCVSALAWRAHFAY